LAFAGMTIILSIISIPTFAEGGMTKECHPEFISGSHFRLLRCWNEFSM